MGWGDRTGTGSTAQQALASNVFNLGASLTGIMAQEDMRAADFLASYAVVDRNRVASVGFSMGCFRSWMVAALSDTIRAGVCANWMANDAGLMVPGNNQLTGSSAFQQMLPGMFKWFDYPDAASIAAPKPMFFFAGQTDPLFPIAAAQAAWAKMQAVWVAAGAAGNFQTQIGNNAHLFSAIEQAAAFAWLDQMLPPGGGWIPPSN
jgi:dienelactone hydrolase